MTAMLNSRRRMMNVKVWKTVRDQRGITGLETAIVLIAFVVVASVFAFAVIIMKRVWDTVGQELKFRNCMQMKTIIC